jgi:hypothetical protein
MVGQLDTTPSNKAYFLAFSGIAGFAFAFPIFEKRTQRSGVPEVVKHRLTNKIGVDDMSFAGYRFTFHRSFPFSGQRLGLIIGGRGVGAGTPAQKPAILPIPCFCQALFV